MFGKVRLKLFQTLKSKRSPLIGCREKVQTFAKGVISFYLSTVVDAQDTENNTIKCKAK